MKSKTDSAQVPTPLVTTQDKLSCLDPTKSRVFDFMPVESYLEYVTHWREKGFSDAEIKMAWEQEREREREEREREERVREHQLALEKEKTRQLELQKQTPDSTGN